jgi:hypothetical protein
MPRYESIGVKGVACQYVRGEGSQIKSGNKMRVRGRRRDRGKWAGKRNMVVAEGEQELDADERDITWKIGAGAEGRDMWPHVEEVIDAAVIAVGLKRIRGGVDRNCPRHRVSKGTRPLWGKTPWVVGVRAVKILPPSKFVRKKSPDHKHPLMIYVAKGIPVDDSVSSEVNEDADPVSVVAIDGKAEVIVEKRIDTAAARVEAEPW